MNAKGLRKKLKNGLIVEKWDLVTIIEQQEKEIKSLKLKLNQLTAVDDNEEEWKRTREYCS